MAVRLASFGAVNETDLGQGVEAAQGAVANCFATRGGSLGSGRIRRTLLTTATALLPNRHWVVSLR
jgi:hypothetical protein